MTIRPFLLAALGLLFPLPLLATPALNVGGLYDYLDAARSTVLKRVRNGGDSTAFVKVSVAELVYDDDGSAREVDQDTLPLEARGLIASPARLIVPARGMQSVRLLYRGSVSRSGISVCVSFRYYQSSVTVSRCPKPRRKTTRTASRPGSMCWQAMEHCCSSNHPRLATRLPWITGMALCM